MASPIRRMARVLAVKNEAVIGTPETLAAADAIPDCYDIEFPNENESEDIDGDGGGGPLTSVIGGNVGSIKFKTRLRGGGTPATPQYLSRLLPMCGMVAAVANTYKPSQLPPGAAGALTKTGSIGGYHDGRKFLLAGTMGTAKFVFPAGKPAFIEWMLKGVWNAVTDVAMLAAPAMPMPALRFVSSALSVHGFSPKVSQLELDLNQTPEVREDSAAAAAFHSAYLGNARRIIGTLDPEAELVASFDTYGKLLAMTEGAMSWALNGGAGNTATFSVPKAQFKKVSPGERKGMELDQLEYQANRNSAAGDDECSIVFT